MTRHLFDFVGMNGHRTSDRDPGLHAIPDMRRQAVKPFVAKTPAVANRNGRPAVDTELHTDPVILYERDPPRVKKGPVGLKMDRNTGQGCPKRPHRPSELVPPQ